ncbi:hypothetical protein HYX05_01995 [Candidatus Woesearchaeota archaeon]|nr:hypothetical protein [Candidatus Woesearchaeota archaeon]
MSKKREIKRLSEESIHIQQCWKDAIGYIENDLSYIWTDEVKRDFEGIKGSARKIVHILERLRSWYNKTQGTDQALESLFDYEIDSIGVLISHLIQIKSEKKYILMLYKDLERIIQNTERIKSNMVIDERTNLIDGFVCDLIAIWLLQEVAINEVRKSHSRGVIKPTNLETRQNITSPDYGVFHLLKSFTENILDASDVIHYFREFLAQSKFLLQVRRDLKSKSVFLLRLTDRELIESLQRQKTRITKILEEVEG